MTLRKLERHHILSLSPPIPAPQGTQIVSWKTTGYNDRQEQRWLSAPTTGDSVSPSESEEQYGQQEGGCKGGV